MKSEKASWNNGIRAGLRVRVGVQQFGSLGIPNGSTITENTWIASKLKMSNAVGLEVDL